MIHFTNRICAHLVHLHMAKLFMDLLWVKELQDIFLYGCSCQMWSVNNICDNTRSFPELTQKVYQDNVKHSHDLAKCNSFFSHPKNIFSTLSLVGLSIIQHRQHYIFKTEQKEWGIRETFKIMQPQRSWPGEKGRTSCHYFCIFCHYSVFTLCKKIK